MNCLDMVNSVLRDTSAALPVDTVAGLSEDSVPGMTLKYLQRAQKDTSRKVPQAALRFTGSITLVAKVNLHEQFSDMDADSVVDNALSVVNGSSEVAGASDNALQVDPAWVGRLLKVGGDSELYRVKSVHTGNATLTLADMAGNESEFHGTTKSTDASGNALTKADAWAATNTYATAEVAQDRYLLPENFKAPIGHFQNLLDPRTLVFMSDEKFDEYVRDDRGSVFTLADAPTHYTIRTATTKDGKARFYVEFYPVPEEARLIPFRYEGSPSLVKNDNDVSGYQPEYEEAILARCRYYVYRLIKNEPEQAVEEDRLWREIVGDQQKNPLTVREAIQFQPVTDRDHWAEAFD